MRAKKRRKDLDRLTRYRSLMTDPYLRKNASRWPGLDQVTIARSISRVSWDVMGSFSPSLRLRNYILINFSLAVCINEIIACYRARKIVARKNGRKSIGKKAFSRRRLTILGTVITHNYRPRLIFRHRELRKLISNNLYLHNQDSCALVCRPILIVVTAIFHAARIRCSTYQDGFCGYSRLFF